MTKGLICSMYTEDTDSELTSLAVLKSTTVLVDCSPLPPLVDMVLEEKTRACRGKRPTANGAVNLFRSRGGQQQRGSGSAT